jgi:hypothetical protein
VGSQEIVIEMGMDGPPGWATTPAMVFVRVKAFWSD